MTETKIGGWGEVERKGGGGDKAREVGERGRETGREREDREERDRDR